MPREWLPSRLPIIQAPMAGSQGVELCVAVSAGGRPRIDPSAMLTPNVLRGRSGKSAPARALPSTSTSSATRPGRRSRARRLWLESRAGAYAEAGLDSDATGAGPGRAPFDAAMAEVVEALKPPVVSFHFGLPEEALLERVEGERSKILFLRDHGRRGALARSARSGRRYRARGGGRRPSRNFLSEDVDAQPGLSRFCRRSSTRSAFRSSPRAGSPMDGASPPPSRSARAPCRLAPHILRTPQAATTSHHRAALREARDDATRLTNLFTGRPARGVLNQFMREHGPMSDAAPAFPFATGAVAPLRAHWEKRGSGDYSPLWAGQAAALAAEEDAGALTERLWREAKATLAALRLEP